jgi:hypothetical protein
MDVDIDDLLPMLQQQLGALMIENIALRAQIQKLTRESVPVPTGTVDEE